MNFINRFTSKCFSLIYKKPPSFPSSSSSSFSSSSTTSNSRHNSTNSTSSVRELLGRRDGRVSGSFKKHAKKYVMLVIPVSSFVLGVWQVRRRKWKLQLIEDLNHRVNQPTRPLPEDLLELDGMEYMKVAVTGSFDHSRETLILPRVNIQSIDKNIPIQNGGAHVVTPFKLTDGREILVNRGWVPKKKIDPETRKHAQITDEVELVGVVRRDEIRPAYSAPTSKEHWHSRDIHALSQRLGTLPVFIDADIKSSIEGGPVGGQTRVHVRNEHMQYILTWFTLSAATSFMWLKMFILK